MSTEVLAFFTGLLASLHCVAMCGPLVMSLPLAGGSWWFNLIQRLVYQSGRILTYSALGFFAGFLGKGFHILGLQQTLSFVSGILLIVIAFFHLSATKQNRLSRFQLNIVGPIATHMGRWLSRPYGGLVAGAMHGLLPCGMVYMAMAASLNAGSAGAGSKFMLLFGLGTTPLLFLASLAPIFLKKFRAPQILIPALFLISGLFLISRAFNMQIPYVSSSVIMNNTMPAGHHTVPVCR